MKFTSLEDAFQANYIKSIPVLTHLDLTANEIKLLELILSYTRTGNQFYMNYADIANYLVVSKGKTKAKVVEKIVRRLCKAGYITKVTTTNFNGRNGGSSANIQVDETFLEEQLHKVFNPERFQIEPAHETVTEMASTTTKNIEVYENSPISIPNAKANNLTVKVGTTATFRLTDKINLYEVLPALSFTITESTEIIHGIKKSQATLKELVEYIGEQRKQQQYNDYKGIAITPEHITALKAIIRR